MPRSPRRDEPGARHHVMNRAARREAMFLDDEACVMFLDALADVPHRFGARIHGYALMPNHYHLMIEVPRGNISDVMRHVGGVFTQAWNRHYGHDGAVFRGRFKNQLVTDDAYWMYLLAYLHLNPVRAHLVPGPALCPWTSHVSYLDGRLRPEWLTTDELLEMLGGPEGVAAYVEAVQRKRVGAPDGFDPARFWVASNTEQVPRPRQRTLRSPEQALADVAAVMEVSVERLMVRERGPSPNAASWLAVWWLLQGAGLSQAAVAGRLGVSRARVGHLRSKLVDLAGRDSEMRDAMARLEALAER